MLLDWSCDGCSLLRVCPPPGAVRLAKLALGDEATGRTLPDFKTWGHKVRQRLGTWDQGCFLCGDCTGGCWWLRQAGFDGGRVCSSAHVLFCATKHKGTIQLPTPSYAILLHATFCALISTTSYAHR